MLYVVAILTALMSAVSALLSATETAVMVLPTGRVHRLVEAEAPGAVALEQMSIRPHRVRAASALAHGVASAGAAILGVYIGSVLPDFPGLLAEGLAALAMVLVVFTLFGALPRALAVANPERIGLESAAVSAAATALLYPLARLLGAPWSWLVHVAGGEQMPSPWATSGEYRHVDDDDTTEREEAEEALLEAVSDFAEKIAREVMVPRTDVAALPDTATHADAIRVVGETGFSRLPVFHGSIDDVRGVLYAKDLLGVCGFGDSEQPILPLAREPFFVPETKPVEELLREMRAKTHIAIVADEYGGTAGIVTLEDLLEEIVGDIADEYDREEPLLTRVGDERYRVDARLPVDDLNEVFGTDIETEADSVGGLFADIAGRIPKAGDALVIEGLRFTVDVLEGTRIRQLSVEPAEADERTNDA
ncbi:MAG: HlyC/CorC family transporter [Coriobacteriia bacterium]|nr:HlyC/CorC family transporter [Coriobacteriia bacterium]